MGRVAPVQTNFTAGELSDRLLGRIDVSKYANGAAKLENFVVHPHGGASRRAGTHFVAEVRDSADNTILIPFEFNVTQAYMLEFGDQYMRVYKDNGVVTEAAQNVTGATSASPIVITIAGHGYSTGDDVYMAGMPGDFAVLNGNRYRVTYIGLNTFSLDGTDGGGFAAYSGPAGTASKVYQIATPFVKADLAELQFAQDADVMWLVHPNYQPRTLTRSAHTNWTLAPYAPTANPFTGAGDYPRAVTFYQQRLYFAGTDNAPQKIFATKTGNYYGPGDMTVGTADGDGFTYTLVSGSVNVIQWLAAEDALLIGTAGGEFKAAGGNDSAITPTNIDIRPQSQRGSAHRMPASSGAGTIFIQRSKRKLREMSYSLSSDNYAAQDITVLAEHITRGGVEQLAYQQDPDAFVWAIRSDGVLLGVTYEKDHEVLAWHRHIFGGTAAQVKSIGVIPIASGDQLWLIISRVINGATVQYVEYIDAEAWRELITESAAESQILTAQQDCFYVDSGLTYDGAPTTELDGLDHLIGETVAVLADGAVHPSKVVDADGKITLDYSAEKVHAGLPYVSLIETLPVEAGEQDGTAMGRRKGWGRITLKVHQSMGGEVNGEELEWRKGGDPMDRAPLLYTGDKRVNNLGYDDEGRNTIIQNYPLPFTVLAITGTLVANDG